MIGQTLGGYRIIEQIGLGGMATVYKAYHASTDRHVALKVLPAHFATQPTFLQRFREEARLIARMEHDHILPIYDFGEDHNIAYLALRYVDHGTLKDLIQSGPLSLENTALYLAQLASALDYAHSRDVIHRDVKPSNILFDSSGRILLADFGISKMVGGSKDLTGSSIIGTPSYMAPDVAMGSPSSHLSDQYSLGIVLYEMLAGRVPYDAETPMAILNMHVHAPLPVLAAFRPNLPSDVSLVVEKVLSKEPEKRFVTCTQVSQAFDSALKGQPIRILTARPKGIPGNVVQRDRVVFGGLGTGIAAIILMFYAAYIGLPSQFAADWLPASDILMWFSALVGLLAVVGGSSLAVRWSGATNRLQAGWYGMRAGVIAGLMIFTILGSSAAGVLGIRDVLAYGARPALNNTHMIQLLVDAVTRTVVFSFSAFWLAILLGGVLGGIGGLVSQHSTFRKPAIVSEARVRLLTIPPLIAVVASAIGLIVMTAIYTLLPVTLGASAQEAGVSPALPSEGIARWAVYSEVAIYVLSLIWLLVILLQMGSDEEASSNLRLLVGAGRIGVVLSLLMGPVFWLTNGIALRPISILGFISVGMGLVYIVMNFNIRSMARAQELAEMSSETMSMRDHQGDNRLRFMDTILYLLVIVGAAIVLGLVGFILGNATRALLCGLPVVIGLLIYFERRVVRRSHRQSVDQQDARGIRVRLRNFLSLSLSSGVVIWIPLWLIAAPALNMVLGIVEAIPLLQSFDATEALAVEDMFTTAGLIQSLFQQQAAFGSLSLLGAVILGALLSLLLSVIMDIATPAPKY